MEKISRRKFLRAAAAASLSCAAMTAAPAAGAQALSVSSLLFGSSLPDGTANIDSTVKAPNVTSEMCRAQFWLDKTWNAGKIILTPSEIEALNKRIIETDGTNMYELADLPATYNGTQKAQALASFESPAKHYLYGEPVPESYYQAMRDNILNADVSDVMELKYGVCVNRTVMKGYPYSDYLSDSASDPEWDDFVSAAINVNEPLALYMTTADGEFTLVQSRICSGWVSTADIAVCADKAQWAAATSFNDRLVVTDEKIYLEDSSDAALAQKMLSMGTVLELDNSYADKIASRLPWNNYVVKLPARNADGSFSQKYAMIPANRDVNVGYLPYSAENIITQAFKLLGNRYGWGGMLNSQDCSSFVHDVYSCVGLNIPRNTTWQAKMPVDVTDISDMTDDEKKSLLNRTPIGAILQFPGHEMLYLGENNGLYYTINDVSSLVYPDGTGGVIRPRGVIVNDLSTQRANGTTWLNNLNRVIVVK